MKLRYEPRLAYVLQGVPIRFNWRFVYTVGRGLSKCANQKKGADMQAQVLSVQFLCLATGRIVWSSASIPLWTSARKQFASDGRQLW